MKESNKHSLEPKRYKDSRAVEILDLHRFVMHRTHSSLVQPLLYRMPTKEVSARGKKQTKRPTKPPKNPTQFVQFLP